MRDTQLVKGVKAAAAIVAALGVIIGGTYTVLGLTFVTKAEAEQKFAPRSEISEIKRVNEETRQDIRELRNDIKEILRAK